VAVFALAIVAAGLYRGRTDLTSVQSAATPARSRTGNAPAAGDSDQPLDTLKWLDSLLGAAQTAYGTGRIDDALDLYGEIATQSLALGADFLTARAFTGLADCYVLQGNIEQARRYYREEAIPRFTQREVFVPRGEAIAKRSLADIERKIGDPDTARALYLRSRTLYILVEDPVGEAITLHGLGELERSLGEIDSARIYYLMSDSLLKSEGHILGQANVMHSLGDLEFGLGNMNVAQQHYEEELDLTRQAGTPLGEANAHYGLGNVALSKGDYSLSRQNFDQADAIYNRIGNRLGQANIAVGYGDLAVAQKDYDEAEKKYLVASRIFGDLKMLDQQSSIRTKLAVTRGAKPESNR
jgi:tetratricopeptide (TPR) repeat protein